MSCLFTKLKEKLRTTDSKKRLKLAILRVDRTNLIFRIAWEGDGGWEGGGGVGGGGVHLRVQLVFCNLRTTCATLIKLCLSRKNLITNIFNYRTV